MRAGVVGGPAKKKRECQIYFLPTVGKPIKATSKMAVFYGVLCCDGRLATLRLRAPLSVVEICEGGVLLPDWKAAEIAKEVKETVEACFPLMSPVSAAQICAVADRQEMREAKKR